MSETIYLDIAGIASRLHVGPESVRTYHTRAKAKRRRGLPSTPRDLPAPDTTIGNVPAWKEDTITRWISERNDYETVGPKPRTASRRTPRTAAP